MKISVPSYNVTKEDFTNGVGQLIEIGHTNITYDFVINYLSEILITYGIHGMITMEIHGDTRKKAERLISLSNWF